MILNIDNRRIYYDLSGDEGAPVITITHSLSSDGGMWAEQMPALLAAGFRVLIARRGYDLCHG
jgi:3-oxoadipate enol-lactonase